MRISDWSSDVCSSDLTPPTGFHAAMPSRQHRSSGCCCACACAALSSSGPTRGLLLPELKYQWAMGGVLCEGKTEFKAAGQPTKCRRSGLRPPTRGGSAREHPAEEVAVVPRSEEH